MKTSAVLLVALFCSSVAECHQQSGLPASSTVELRIADAQKQLLANPNSPDALNNLAFALIRKGRDVRDEATYLEAGKVLDKSMKAAAVNYQAQKLRVAVLLGLNQSADALKLGDELIKKTPDDISLWALLVDANVTLGNYAQAEIDAQWVLDLRPGSSIGFEKAAMLREWFGDSEGAVEFLDETNRRTSQSDADQKAWLLTQKARIVLVGGNTRAANDLLIEAFRIFPDSQLAEGVLAQVRLAEANSSEAANILERRYRRVPSAENLYDWAKALSVAGRSQEATLEFTAFEKQARAEMPKHNAAILDLISYYSDTKPDPAEALALATAESVKRHDSPTLAAYAWALYRSGNFTDAKLQMDKALAIGVRNPLYLCYAASISSRTKDASCPDNAPLQSASRVTP